MDLVVKRADLIRDRHAIVGLHKKFLAPHCDEKRFDWLYCQNPFGSPLVWIAQEIGSGEAVGTAAAFPRSLQVGSKKEFGWVLGDFCVSDAYRSLGPALQLQRKCLEGVGLGENSIWYDFPSRKMLAIYKRLKIFPSCNMVRFVKPLRIDRRVESWVKGGFLQKGLAELGNKVLNWTTKTVSVRKGLTFHSHGEERGSEFTETFEEIGEQLGNCLERTAAYVDWRYAQNPLYTCRLLTARLNDRLKGYIVYADIEGEAIILDLFGHKEQDIILGLIGQVIEKVRDRGSQSLSVSMVERHIWIPFFESFGFKPRDMDPVIIQNPMGENQRTNGEYDGASLLLMQGDRDA